MRYTIATKYGQRTPASSPEPIQWVVIGPANNASDDQTRIDIIDVVGIGQEQGK